MARAHDPSQLPLNGVVMCCTSIPAEQRSELATIAAEMGAISKLDLTADVTHLIVGDTDTPKYKYVAKERADVRVLLPDWIKAVRDKWISGADELDLPTLERDYRVPTFYNLRICVTGFEDLAFRKQLEEWTVNNGAAYKGDLTKDITHLLAHSVQSQKYRYAKQWGIKIVTLEWFQQSLERGMILDEMLYDPLMEPHERGKGAWIRRSVSATSLGKRRRGENSPSTSVVQNRKLRRSASSRFDSQSEGFWTDIVSAAPQAVETSVTSKWDEDRGVDETILELRRPSKDISVRNPFTNAEPMPAQPKGIFAGSQFILYGFDEKKTTILRKHLSSHDATILATPTDSHDTTIPDCLLLVPHNMSINQSSQLLKSRNSSIVTDFWLEKCLHKKTYIDYRINPSYSPFRFPVKGFESLVVSSTAFEGIDLLHLSKIVALTGGAKYDEFLTKKTSILLCNNSSMSRDKTKHALEWQIPAVNADWLWDTIKSGTLQDLKLYLIYPSAQQHLQLGPVEQADHANQDQPLERPQEAVAKQQSDESDKAAAQPRPLAPINQDSDVKTQSGPFFEDEAPEYLPVVYDEPQNFQSEHQDGNKLNDTINHIPTKPLPLQERSPNSPTKPKSPNSKYGEEKEIANRQEVERAILSDTLQTILSRQKSSSSAHSLQRTTSSGSARGTAARREKRLLGRATSNLSARSGNSGVGLAVNVNHSRASSIDTLHTDGLGTPIEGPPPAAVSALLKQSSKDGQSFLTASALTSHDELLAADDDDEDNTRPDFQMTQVGYEDPEAGKWRAKFLKKISAGKDAQGVSNIDDEALEDHENVDENTRKTVGGFLEDDDPVVAGAAAGAGKRTRKQRGS